MHLFCYRLPVSLSLSLGVFIHTHLHLITILAQEIAIFGFAMPWVIIVGPLVSTALPCPFWHLGIWWGFVMLYIFILPFGGLHKCALALWCTYMSLYCLKYVLFSHILLPFCICFIDQIFLLNQTPEEAGIWQNM